MAEPIQSLMKPQSGRDITFQRSKDEMAQKMAAQGFTNVKDLGGGMTSYTLPERASGGQVGQSFGRMIGGGLGGGIPGMGGLEAASMRLADAAAKRERETKEFEYRLKLKETKRQEFRDEISRLESELRQAESSPVRDNTEQMLRNRNVARLRDAISRAKSQLRQFD